MNLQLDALMDQRSATWRDTGRKVPVSTMDLVILANLAAIGTSYLLTVHPDGTESDAKASAALDRVTRNIIQGLTAGRTGPRFDPKIVAVSLAMDGAAILSDRFRSFSVCVDDPAADRPEGAA